MNILKGKLSKRAMARFAGVEIGEVDESLARLADMGFLKYKKIKGGKYQFILTRPVGTKKIIRGS